MPLRAFVATLADRKIIAAECSLPVVTACATERTGRRMMIQRCRRRNLPSSSRTSPHLMTRPTSQLLRRIVTCMTEPNSIGRRLLRSANQTPGLMTSAARRDVFSVCLRSRRVTAKTRDVSIQSRRNREPNTTTISTMTRGTSRTTVFRVIERRVETAQRWKRLDLSTLSIRVTDRADLTRLICKLLSVTAGARRMCGFARQRRLR